MLLVNIYKTHIKRKITQAEIVKVTGLSPVTVNKLFDGKYHDFKFSSVEKLAKFLGCSVMDILVEAPDNN